MADVVVHGPVSWNHIIGVDELPDPSPHMQFATGHHEVLGGTSAGKAAHLRDLGVDVELHTVLGTDAAAGFIKAALRSAGISYVATRVDGPSERHLNLMDPAGGRVSIYLDTPAVPRVAAAAATARLLEASAQARALVLDLSDTSRAAIDAVSRLAVPLWTDLHDYDGHSSFHRPFLEAASFVFMNADRLPAPHDFLRDCVGRGAQVAVCTLGAKGAVALDANLRTHEVPAAPVDAIVDFNGAGDGFMAGFIAAHLDGAGTEAAMRAGAAQAARALTTVQLSPLLGSGPVERQS
jgi:sugar/nucleoside kinase (ribokinase family)